jgi:hypothetical protein
MLRECSSMARCGQPRRPPCNRGAAAKPSSARKWPAASTRRTSRQERDAPRLRKAIRAIAGRMVEAGGARRQGASRQLKEAARHTASRMAEAGAASTWAAPRQLKEAARHTASRMAGASAASTRAALRQSLELPAVCTARYVSSASSPTMRRTMHRNSVARPRRPKPRVGWRRSCEILHRRRVESAGPPTG